MFLWLRSFVILLVILFVLGGVFVFHEIQAASTVTSVTVSLCGNGVIEGDETCDDGANNGKYGYCNGECTGWGPRCGDGIIQSAHNEECDDGNTASGDGCSSTCQTEDEEEPPPPSGGGGGLPAELVPISVEPGIVILEGKAYPDVEITILMDGKIATTTFADAQANFQLKMIDISAGVYTFGTWAKDKQGRKSITFSFTVTISAGLTTTIGGIFIPPTIELEKTKMARGEILNVFGSTAPQSEVNIYIEAPEIIRKITADNEGNWNYSFNTSPLEDDSYNIRAKAASPDGFLSSFSHILNFYIGEVLIEKLCPRADLNKDGKTDLVDFSIMLFWWGKDDSCSDQNQDNKVDLIDFSIMMYWWTG